MEFIIVKFPETRSVLIDGEEGGFTNTTLRMEEGTHTFSLGGKQDYKPSTLTLKIQRTTMVKPMEVIFEKR